MKTFVTPPSPPMESEVLKHYCVIGLVIITAGGLFTTAYLQWVRGSESIDF